MRLREMQLLLQDGVFLINTVTTTPQPHSRTQLGNLRAVRLGIEYLRRVPPLAGDIAPLLNSPFIANSPEDVLLLDVETGTSIVSQLQLLNAVAARMQNFLNAALPVEPETSVSFRVPETESVADLASIVHQLSDVFAQTLQPVEKYGSFRLLGFDTGSMWINIVLDTPEALVMILSLVGAAGWFHNAKKRNQEQEAEARRHAEREQAKMVEELFEKMLASKRAEAIDRLVPGAENEDRSRVGAALDKYVKIIERGGQITPALGAPVEVRRAYEEERKLMNAAGPPKLLLLASNEDSDEPVPEAETTDDEPETK